MEPTRLNKALMELGYSFKVEGEKVYVFSKTKYSFNGTFDEFQYWALEITAEYYVSQYIISENKRKRCL